MLQQHNHPPHLLDVRVQLRPDEILVLGEVPGGRSEAHVEGAQVALLLSVVRYRLRRPRGQGLAGLAAQAPVLLASDCGARAGGGDAGSCNRNTG